MRNNTKLKRLLESNDLHFSISLNKEMEMIVVNRVTNVSYICSNTSMTNLMNEAMRIEKSLNNRKTV